MKKFACLVMLVVPAFFTAMGCSSSNGGCEELEKRLTACDNGVTVTCEDDDFADCILDDLDDTCSNTFELSLSCAFN